VVLAPRRLNIVTEAAPLAVAAVAVAAAPLPAISYAAAALPPAQVHMEEEAIQQAGPPVNPVRLRAHQLDHVQREMNIWRQHYFLLDTSVMGSGKTHTTCWLAWQCGFSYIMVVCPASVEDNWRSAGAAYGLNVVCITSYESLRSVKGSQPKHGLLTRIDADGDMTFETTPVYREMIARGGLLIGDEVQRVKNKNGQHKAFKALAEHIYRTRGNSRVILLSGTPVDKKEQVVNIMQMLGIIRHHRLYTYHKDEGRLELQGAQELVDYCNFINRDQTTAVLNKTPFTQRNVHDVCYNLYIGVMQRNVVSSMPPPDINVEIDCFNGYYNMSAQGAVALKKAITALHHATRYDTNSGETNMRDAQWSAITTALSAIETAKVEIWIREARRVLENEPTAKVALGFNFQAPLDAVAAALAEYNPLLLTGKVNKRSRPAIIRKFQEPSTTHRLLIGNMMVMSEGINLHDTDGRFPRYAFGSPGYLVMRSHQWSRRFYRDGTRSVPHVGFVHGKCGQEETSILNALTRKSGVLKETLEVQVEHGMLFPGDYLKKIESDTESVLIPAIVKASAISEEEIDLGIEDVAPQIGMPAAVLALPLPIASQPLQVGIARGRGGALPTSMQGSPGAVLPLPVEGGLIQVPAGRSPSPMRGMRIENVVMKPTLRVDDPFAR
ncbi:Hypothetical protein POVN_LOCUS659, partial [uncultured virus]